ncbi:effector-associated constant component EACC1 [Wenjunlia tyrosinilytica]|uniref:Uncharacterized protein n=1 Tax=Wenjunlia tyrosinilytica TaxID=1544741 RepID=A0A917ZL26_9ACTN|nr:hypothetical protein [Wenjunlia tyrosinilytica]GGO85222.1 hypothetical protein GCM10012280_18510 [Wenjunlia tyrosinilytica]
MSEVVVVIGRTGTTEERESRAKGLRNWLAKEPEINERVTAVERESEDRTLGVVTDFALDLTTNGAGALLAMLIRSLLSWLRNRRERDQEAFVEVRRNGRVIRLTGVEGATPGEIAELVRRLLDGDPPQPPGEGE